MKKIFPSVLLLCVLFNLPDAQAQQLSIEPFAGVAYPIMKTKEFMRSETRTDWNGNTTTSKFYTKDKYNAAVALTGGFRTRMQLKDKWGIQLETGLQQMRFNRDITHKLESYNYPLNEYRRSGNLRLLNFYQSLEGSCTFGEHLSVSAGGYVSTLLSSYQDWPLFAPGSQQISEDAEELKKAGHGLRDSQLGVQAHMSYLFPFGLSATATVRQPLQSIFSEEAQPAGPVRPTIVSLTLGYRLKVN